MKLFSANFFSSIGNRLEKILKSFDFERFLEQLIFYEPRRFGFYLLLLQISIEKFSAIFRVV